MRQLVVIAHNLRSTHNVGSLLRTADGLGVGKIWLTGYSPYPLYEKDLRLPHLANKIDRQIAKTALGAEKTVPWEYAEDVYPVIEKLRQDGFQVIALEQAKQSLPLPDFRPEQKAALVIGREVEGIEAEVLQMCDAITEIPMFGVKESYNVVQAAAMALYHCRFTA